MTITDAITGRKVGEVHRVEGVDDLWCGRWSHPVLNRGLAVDRVCRNYYASDEATARHEIMALDLAWITGVTIWGLPVIIDPSMEPGMFVLGPPQEVVEHGF